MTTQTAETPAATGTATLNRLFADRAASQPDRVALRRKVGGKWEDVSWKGYRDAARKIGLGLVRLGLEPGQRAAILSETRVEWAFCDLGILGVRGVTVPIYQSSIADEVVYILQDAGARFLLLENLDQWRKLHARLSELPEVEKFVIFDTSDTEKTRAQDAPFEGNPRVMTLDQLLELGEREEADRFDELAARAEPDETVTLIYTSGTTGNPKGVVLTHANAMGECSALMNALDAVGEDDITVAFLPLAHVFARALHWMQLRAGYVTAYAESIAKLVDNLGEVRPTFLAAVPRIYEKIHAGVLAKVEEEKPLKKKYVRWALSRGLERDRRLREGVGVGLGLGLSGKLAAPAVNKIGGRLRERTGGRVRFFISGGAPLSSEIAEFFHMIGLVIYEGYGLTETTAATHLNRPGAFRIGTVGRTLPGVECRIAEDGEILLKGPMVMKGYYNKPEATAEVLKDGWFATGDIGEIDGDGFLRITDRKKDLIVTAAGKNIAPQNVENLLKTAGPISQVAMFGDRQKFCVALVTLDEPVVRLMLEKEGVTPPAALEELSQHPRVRELVQQAIDDKNRQLPSYSTIKYFEILPRDFEVGHELTPTLKVRRKEVKKRWGHLVDGLYARAGGGGE